jgi:hypothetical protein
VISPVISVAPVAPSQALNACYFFCQVQPAIAHGLAELTATNTRHIIIETALISYLMGMGFDYSTALAIVESWETDNTLLAEGILVE